jgi:hypothetical protein
MAGKPPPRNAYKDKNGNGNGNGNGKKAMPFGGKGAAPFGRKMPPRGRGK